MNHIEREKSKTKVILSSSLAGWLMFNSFHLVNVKPDAKNIKKNIYIFSDTDKLNECIGDYESHKSMRKYY